MYILSTLFLVIVTGLLYIYWFFKQSHKFFDQYDIPYPKPHWLFGNMKDVVLWKKAIWFVYKDLYDKHVSDRFVGVYTLHRPGIMVRDPELIKSILVKDFSHFRDRGFPLDKEAEPLAVNLFSMTGDEWKNMRIKLTSTFSSGKMKMMFPLLKRCAEDIQPALKRYMEEGQDFEAKDFAARYATDVIGSCAFGIDIHSLQNPESEFRKVGRTVFASRWQQIVRGLNPKLPTSVIKYFKLQFFPVQACDYFLKLVTDMVKYREENNVTRGDFLDILIAMKNHKDLEKLKDQQDECDLAKFMAQIGQKTIKSDVVEMTIEVMAAQSFLFFIGGFEGASTTLMLLLFEMAQNPDVQNKLRQEIISTLESNGGEFTYDMMKKMPYLEMVLSEVWRRCPTVPFLMRECTENYRIPSTDAVIKKGIPVIIPTLGLQMDKKYFEKPDEFYPEHFTEEAKRERHPFVYLPFGEGPRVCIAERFARMQVIVGAVYLLKDFFFELSPKTKVPLEFAPGGAVIVKGGVWLKCRTL